MPRATGAASMEMLEEDAAQSFVASSLTPRPYPPPLKMDIIP